MKLTEWRQTLENDWLTWLSDCARERKWETGDGEIEIYIWKKKKNWQEDSNNVWLQMIGNFAVIFEHVSWHFAESLTPLINESDVGHYKANTAAAAAAPFTAAYWIRNVVKLSFVNLSIFRLLSIFLMSIHSLNMLYCAIHCTVSYHVKQIAFAHNLRIEPNPPVCKLTELCAIAGERERV